MKNLYMFNKVIIYDFEPHIIWSYYVSTIITGYMKVITELLLIDTVHNN